MLLKYLNRKHTHNVAAWLPCGQLVNVPQLQGTQRCRYCMHNGYFNDNMQYATCMSKNKCGEESLLYPLLHNSVVQGTRPKSDHFSPSQVIKSTTIDNMTRYIQLWSCDLEGYECCRLCQFYAARIASEVSIADCSNSHACGRNGSWWDLLQLNDQSIIDLPDIFNLKLPEGQFYTMDYQLHNATFVEFEFTNNGYVKAKMSDGNSYYIVNMGNTGVAAWHILNYVNSNVATWRFSSRYEEAWFTPSECLMFNDYHANVGKALVDAGMDELQFWYTQNVCARAQASDGNYYQFTQLASSFDRQLSSSKYVLTISDAAGSVNCAIRFLNSDYYLTLPYSNADISLARKTKFTNGISSDIPYIRVAAFNTDIVNLLRAKGLRSSLFYNI